jgi:hypothetical protein
MLLLLASFLLPWDTLSFGPQVGSTVSKTFEGRFELTLDSLTMTMDGKEHDMGEDGAREGCTGTYSVAVDDRYAAVGGGRPVDLVRTYGPITGAFESSAGASHAGTLEKLEGKAVRFTWDAEESA